MYCTCIWYWGSHKRTQNLTWLFRVIAELLIISKPRKISGSKTYTHMHRHGNGTNYSSKLLKLQKGFCMILNTYQSSWNENTMYIPHSTGETNNAKFKSVRLEFDYCWGYGRMYIVHVGHVAMLQEIGFKWIIETRFIFYQSLFGYLVLGWAMVLQALSSIISERYLILLKSSCCIKPPLIWFPSLLDSLRP